MSHKEPAAHPDASKSLAAHSDVSQGPHNPSGCHATKSSPNPQETFGPSLPFFPPSPSSSSLPPPFQHLQFLRLRLAEAEGDVVDLQGDLFGVGHRSAAPMVVLHGDVEGDERGVGRAEGGQLINARPHEVVAPPIEGGVVGVPAGHADRPLYGHALPHSLHHAALLARFAAAFIANHHPQGGVAAATRVAQLVCPKLLSWSVVEAVVGATAAGGRHALRSAEDVAWIASAAFHAGLGARLRGVGVEAGRGAGGAAGVVVAVLGAGQCCKRRGNNGCKREQKGG